MYTAELWVFAGGLSRSGGHAPLCCLLRGYYTCLGLSLVPQWGRDISQMGDGDGEVPVNDDDDDGDDDDDD